MTQTPLGPPADCADGGSGAAGADVEQTLLCDLDADGNLLGTALAVYEYDENGAPVGAPTFVDPATGQPYVATGTLQPCNDSGCLAPVLFHTTTSATGPVDHPGRQYDLTLPINPGFQVQSMQVDDTNHAANLFWTVFDSDGETFRQNLTTFMEGRLPADAVVTITNPNAGTTICGQALPMTIHIECLRVDQSPPDLVELVYNGGRDLVVNPAYLTTPPTDLSQFQFYYLRRQDAGGTINCTDVANRGWETNDLGDANRDFEIWGTGPNGLAQQSNTTPTPRGTPVQEITADINDTGAGPTIWQTFDVPAAGNFRVQLVHGARDPGEQHTIRLSTGDTNDTGPGDIINDVTNPPSVTNSGGPNPWTVLDQTVPLNAGEYTFSFQTTNPVGAQRGGLFTDMRVYQDVPDQRATAVVDDDTCVVTVDETTTVCDDQYWAPRCVAGDIVSWRNAETGQELANAAFWGQAPAPIPGGCPGSASSGSGGSVAANLVHSYPVCALVGGVATTLQRVVITDGSGGVLADSFVGPDGGPVTTPTDYTIGSCADAAYVNDEILCDDNGPFLRKYIQTVNPITGLGGVESHRDFTLAGAVYSPVGEVGICGPDGDKVFGQVCYFLTPNPLPQFDGFLTLNPAGEQVLYDVNGAVVPAGTYQVTPCIQAYTSEEVLCDAGNANHPFIRRYIYTPVGNLASQSPVADYELDGFTDYVFTGPIGPCATGGGGAADTRDAEVLILCDATPTRFLRRYVYDGETGVPTGFVDTTLDGTTAFAPVGAVGLCTTPVATDFDFAIEQLCDNNGAFLRRFTFNSSTGAVTSITNTTLAGANYAPVGTVGTCEQCCPQVVGQGCTNVGSGRYTAIRAVNGTVSLIDSVTGVAVAPAAIIACPADAIETITAQHRLIGDADAAWTPGADVVGTLLSVTYTVLSGTANVTDQSGTVAAGLPAGLTATWSTEDDANTLSGPQSIDAIGGQTYVNWTQR